MMELNSVFQNFPETHSNFGPNKIKQRKKIVECLTDHNYIDTITPADLQYQKEYEIPYRFHSDFYKDFYILKKNKGKGKESKTSKNKGKFRIQFSALSKLRSKSIKLNKIPLSKLFKRNIKACKTDYDYIQLYRTFLKLEKGEPKVSEYVQKELNSISFNDNVLTTTTSINNKKLSKSIISKNNALLQSARKKSQNISKGIFLTKLKRANINNKRNSNVVRMRSTCTSLRNYKENKTEKDSFEDIKKNIMKNPLHRNCIQEFDKLYEITKIEMHKNKQLGILLDSIEQKEKDLSFEPNKNKIENCESENEQFIRTSFYKPKYSHYYINTNNSLKASKIHDYINQESVNQSSKLKQIFKKIDQIFLKPTTIEPKIPNERKESPIFSEVQNKDEDILVMDNISNIKKEMVEYQKNLEKFIYTGQGTKGYYYKHKNEIFEGELAYKDSMNLFESDWLNEKRKKRGVFKSGHKKKIIISNKVI